MKRVKKLNVVGFTTVEIVVVFVIFSILAGLIAGNLLIFRQRTTTQTTVSTLVNDIKEQQNRAMLEGSEQTISFSPTSYSMNDFEIELDASLEIINVTFPDQRIVFASISGEIKDFVPGQNTITVQNTFNNQAKIININRFGVITSVL